MTKVYENIKSHLNEKQYTWLITGVAGFIGSNLLEALLKLKQKVIGLDNLFTGYEKNIHSVQKHVSKEQWSFFQFIQGDIRDGQVCQQACQGVDYVLHQAALASVPRSIEDPILTNAINVDGFLNMLVASRDNRVKRFIYASSSAVYGDDVNVPQKEDKIGKPLSPYALSKYCNELYANNFADIYGLECLGLRYFNVFGPRQDPNGAYASVIPKWIAAMIKNGDVFINGDGSTSRDFCYIQNVVQINLLAAFAQNKQAMNQVYNVGCNEKTDLHQLFELLRKNLQASYPFLKDSKPQYREFRKGDALHTLADITKAKSLLGYEPIQNIKQGVEDALDWYKENGITS